MKKFCSNCGNRLELSQKFCGECGETNPFFVPAFTILEDNSNEVEQLRLQKEKIELELQQKETQQAEFVRQKQLLELQAQLKNGNNTNITPEIDSEKEALKREVDELRAETQRHKQQLQSSIQQLKFELETRENEIANGLRQEIKQQQIQMQQLLLNEKDLVSKHAEELKQRDIAEQELKQEIAALQQSSASKIENAESKLTALELRLQLLQQDNDELRGKLEEKGILPVIQSETIVKRSETIVEKADKRIYWLIPVSIILLIGLFLFWISNRPSSNSPELSVHVPTDSILNVMVEAANTPADSSNILNSVTDTEPTDAESTNYFVLTTDKITRDLVGKKLSGCDISIAGINSIKDVHNVVCVETLSTGNMKFKFGTRIEQNGHVYKAQPYIYYTPEGRFLRLDATNCE